MRKIILFVVAGLFTVATFGQTGHTAKSVKEAGVTSTNNGVVKTTTMLTETFDTFVIPGAMNGWSLIDSNVVTWDTSTIDPYSGAQNVHCEYDAALALQDEWLVTPAMNFTGASGVEIGFAFLGSKYWAVDPNDNCDLKLRVSINGTWSTVDIPWTEETDTTWTSWTWTPVTVDVSTIAANQANVKFAFQYYGTDGAEFGVDEFTVDTTGGTGSGIAVALAPAYLNVFPVPANNQLNIASSEQISNFRIYNAMGQMVISNETAMQNVTVDVSMLPEGVYYLEMNRTSGKTTQKFTIKR